jgi:hypothetical protein
MHLPHLLSLSLIPSASASALAQSTILNATYLTAPALITTPQNTTTIQCWRLTAPFTRSARPGIIGAQTLSVANVTDISYIITPPRFDGGLHNAPVAQYVHFSLPHHCLPIFAFRGEKEKPDNNRIVHVLSGLAHITLPQDEAKELWLVGGKGALLIAADTSGMGHVTVYPSDQETVTFVTPFEGGRVPEHEVVNEGPCEGVQTWV